MAPSCLTAAASFADLSKATWPVGFVSQRDFPSYARAGTTTAYVSEIVDVNGNLVFRVTAQDDRDHPIAGPTPSRRHCSCATHPSDCWGEVVYRLQVAQGIA
jgi:hypothetical protein